MRPPVLALALLASCATSPSAWRAARSVGADEAAERARLAGLAAEVTVHRDAFGVPHVHGPTDASVVFGLAYARAEDEFGRVEQALFATLGRNAEAVGEPGVAWDRLVHALDLPGLARSEYATMPRAERALCDAAADGLTWFLLTHPEVEPRLLRRFEPWHFLAAEYTFHLYALGQALEPRAPGSDGSNAWAVAPDRTVNGHALLLANPHIPLDQVYEAHVDSDEGLHVSGMLAYGRGILPVIGFNRRVAWSLTVNRPDNADVYALRFDHPEDPLAYRHGDGWRRATERAVTVRVRAEDGTVESRELVLRRTHHGPIVREEDGRAWAVRVAGIEQGGQLGQWYAMARAEDLASFRAAVGRTRLLFHNVVYADADGHVWYVYNGAIPRRDPALDWRAAVDGNDPGTDWRGLHALDELPQVLDPECGWVQSCNSLPWTTCAAGNPRLEDFPPYLVGAEQDDPRVALSHAVLGRARPFAFEEWAAAAFDPSVHDPHGMLARLLADLREQAATERGARLAPAALVLGAWDRRMTVDSVAATLYLLWIERVVGHGFDGADLPEGVPAGNLASVLEDLDARFGTWRVPWGELNRHQRPRGATHSDERASLPCPGGHAWAGLTFCFLSRRPEGCQLRYGHHGNSYVAAVELTPDGPRASTILAFGQSTDPASPHWDDQAALYVRGETKPAPFRRREVLAAAVRSYHPGLPH